MLLLELLLRALQRTCHFRIHFGLRLFFMVVAEKEVVSGQADKENGGYDHRGRRRAGYLIETGARGRFDDATDYARPNGRAQEAGESFSAGLPARAESRIAGQWSGENGGAKNRPFS